MAFRLFPRFRKEGAPIQAIIEVEPYGKGDHRYEARPVKMAIRGKDVPFQVEDFFTFGRTRRGARKRCLEKVVSYLKEQAKEFTG